MISTISLPLVPISRSPLLLVHMLLILKSVKSSLSSFSLMILEQEKFVSHILITPSLEPEYNLVLSSL